MTYLLIYVPEVLALDAANPAHPRLSLNWGMIAFVESKAAINAIRCGYVCQFKKKPFDKERVKQAAAMAVDHYKINGGSQKLRPYGKALIIIP